MTSPTAAAGIAAGAAAFGLETLDERGEGSDSASDQSRGNAAAHEQLSVDLRVHTAAHSPHTRAIRGSEVLDAVHVTTNGQ